MTAQEALDILVNQRTEYKHGREVLECSEYDEFYAFLISPDNYDGSPVIGGYDTVDKRTGRVSAFNPTQNFDLFFSGKKVSLENLKIG